MNCIRTPLSSALRRTRVRTATVTTFAVPTRKVFAIPNKQSASPLLETFRSSWPDPVHNAPSKEILEALPERTVPDDVLNFRMTSRLESGTSIFYPHLEIHPGDMKVKLEVYIDNMTLNLIEKKIFIRMLGKRYSHGNGKVTLVCRRFPNRLENKKWLTYTLELLLSKSRALALVSGKYEDGQPDNDDLLLRARQVAKEKYEGQKGQQGQLASGLLTDDSALAADSAIADDSADNNEGGEDNLEGEDDEDGEDDEWVEDNEGEEGEDSTLK